VYTHTHTSGVCYRSHSRRRRRQPWGSRREYVRVLRDLIPPTAIIAQPYTLIDYIDRDADTICTYYTLYACVFGKWNLTTAKRKAPRVEFPNDRKIIILYYIVILSLHIFFRFDFYARHPRWIILYTMCVSWLNLYLWVSHCSDCVIIKIERKYNRYDHPNRSRYTYSRLYLLFEICIWHCIRIIYTAVKLYNTIIFNETFISLKIFFFIIIIKLSNVSNYSTNDTG